MSILTHHRCILDGEMLVYDPISQLLLPFGNLKTAAIEGFKSNKGARPCCTFAVPCRA